MTLIIRGWIIGVVLVWGGRSLGDEAGRSGDGPSAPPAKTGYGIYPEDSVFGNWGGTRGKLSQAGINLGLWYNTVFQSNVHGGIDTEDATKGSGNYNLILTLDLKKMLGWQGGRLFTQVEGGFGEGLEGAGKIGDLFGVNKNVIGDLPVNVTSCWFQQSFFNDKVMIMLGKLSLTGVPFCVECPLGFDGNTFANFENIQFMNRALVNNPTIPFPPEGLGAIAYFAPVKWFQIQAGAGDAHANAHQPGFHSAFHDDPRYIFMLEPWFMPQIETKRGPLVGNYRFGYWLNPVPRPILMNDLGGRRRSRFRNDDMGVYVSFDQMVYRENSKDNQGLGFFFRYGFAPNNLHEIDHFWSTGGQYQGLLPGRDDDVLGFGVAQGDLSNKVRPAKGEMIGRETALELYYNIKIRNGIHLSPDAQYILDPGGKGTHRDALVLGIRLEMFF